MDYEKKYKEALEKARQLCAYPTTKPFINDLQDLFPELAESEDEKTRKRIIALVNAHGQGMYKDDMLAWLENIPYTIDHEKREGFHLGYKAGLEKQGESYTKRDVDDAYLKGISDAKNELEKQGQKETKETSVWHEYNEKIDLNRPFLLITPKGQLSIMSWDGKSLKSVTFGGGGGIILEGDKFAYIDELQEIQKTVWGEEEDDDAWMNDIISKVENNLQLNKAEINWLKSLKEKFKIQTRQGISKEDEHSFMMISGSIRQDQDLSLEDKNKLRLWLKSIIYQSRWNPSDEQMKFLQKCIEAYNEVTFPTEVRVLSSLYNDLKKLRGE